MTAATGTVPTVAIADNSIIVRFPYRPDDVTKAKSVLGARWDKDGKAWRYPVTPKVAAGLKAAFGRLSVRRENVEQFRALLDAAAGAEAHQAVKAAQDLPPIPGLKTEAWLHQRQAFHFGSQLPACMYAMEMGTGKSLVIVGEFINLITPENPAPIMLVWCPLSVIPAWAGTPARPGQFQVHTDQRVHVVGLDKGSVADKTAKAKAAVAEARRQGVPCVVVVNPDSARAEPFLSWSTSLSWDLFVMDESHRLKAPGGVTSQAAAKVAKKAKRRRALTGTPLPHGLEDAYAQFRALDPSVFGSSFTAFKNRYCIMGGYGGYQITGYRNEEEFNKLFYSIGYRATKDVLELPGARHINRYFSLGAKAQKAYRDLERHLLAEIEEGKVTASNVLVRLLRLQQLTSGFLPADSEEERTWVQVDSGRMDALTDVLEDFSESEPIVVVCRFKRDLENVHAVATKLGRKSLELSGDRKELERWQNGEAPILAVQEQSGGVGIDLTRSHVGVIYSVNFNAAEYEQFLSRQDRPGQTEPVLFVHLLADNGPIDEQLLQVLEGRMSVAEGLLAELRKEVRS